MKLPKFLRSRNNRPTLTQDEIERQCDVESMSTGRLTLPLYLSRCTKEEAGLIHKCFTPWLAAEIQGTRRIFAYAHFEGELDKKGEGALRMVKKKDTDTGLIVAIFAADGSPWPSADNQQLIQVDQISPKKLADERISASCATQIVKYLLYNSGFPAAEPTEVTE